MNVKASKIASGEWEILGAAIHELNTPGPVSLGDVALADSQHVEGEIYAYYVRALRAVSELESHAGGPRMPHPAPASASQARCGPPSPPATSLVLPERQPFGQTVITVRKVSEEALRKLVAVAGSAQAHRLPHGRQSPYRRRNRNTGGRQN